MVYSMRNKPQAEMTANPSKYPQGYFKPKPCRECGTTFTPQAPSHLSCSQDCADRMLTSRYLQRNYGMTLKQYEALQQKQKRLCAICTGEGFVMASQYVVKGINEWMKDWKARGWKTSSKKPVENLDLWLEIEALLAFHQVTAIWINGHSGHPGNDKADALAENAARFQKPHCLLTNARRP